MTKVDIPKLPEFPNTRQELFDDMMSGRWNWSEAEQMLESLIEMLEFCYTTGIEGVNLTFETNHRRAVERLEKATAICMRYFGGGQTQCIRGLCSIFNVEFDSGARTLISHDLEDQRLPQLNTLRHAKDLISLRKNLDAPATRRNFPGEDVRGKLRDVTRLGGSELLLP